MKTDLANALLLVASLALASWATLVPTESGHDATAQVERAEQVVPVDAPDKVTDARGHTAPVRDYARVVSLNTVSDHVLLELVEPDRLVAITELTLTAHPEAFRFGDLVGVGRSDQLETILGLDPDLVLVSAYADEAFMARLRESGIQVFDLGQMRGVATTLDSIRTLGHLLGQPERAAVVADRYQRQLAGLEAAVPEDQRPHGLYLTVYSDVLYGGSVGSSYGDMLRYGGVHDIASRPPLTAAELGSTSQGPVRESLLVLAWAMALVDEEMAAAEKVLLDHFAAGLRMPAARVTVCRKAAQTYILDQAMDRMFAWGGHDEYARAQLYGLAERIGMPVAEAQEAEARHLRRRAR